jgi:hypothetical protein
MKEQMVQELISATGRFGVLYWGLKQAPNNLLG